MNASVQSIEIKGGASGYLTIDLAALRANYIALCMLAPKSQMAAVVKADCYGLGADIIVPEFYSAGCRLFFVAHLDEALSLRNHIAIDAEIFVLNGLQPGTEASCTSSRISPVLNSLDQIKNWSVYCSTSGTSGRAAVQLDSGMSRLGLSSQELRVLKEYPELLANIDISFVMSHLACADEHQHPQNDAQHQYFSEANHLFADVPKCFANSGGIFLGGAFHHNIIRPGIALYGDAPSGNQPSPVKPVARLDVAVIQTRKVPAGAAIGYSATFVAPHEMRLATIAAGYADGLPRTLSNSGSAWFKGKKLPFVGRVSMDSIILDISALEENELKLGDLVEIIGENQSISDLAEAAGTISYEILTSLGRRYHRVYSNPSATTADISTSNLASVL